MSAFRIGAFLRTERPFISSTPRLTTHIVTNGLNIRIGPPDFFISGTKGLSLALWTSFHGEEPSRLLGEVKGIIGVPKSGTGGTTFLNFPMPIATGTFPIHEREEKLNHDINLSS